MRDPIRTFFAALLLALGIKATAASLPMPHVKIDSGMVEGLPFGSISGSAAFLGIPYATPPTGSLRWKPPLPVASWRGVYSAQKLGPSCPQEPDRAPRYWKVIVSAMGGDPAVVPPLGPTSEDCLTLNVWTTNLSGKTKQPVMVWIHGGLTADRYDEAAVLARDGAVVVTVNYRIGILGFLAHSALTKESPHGSSGNYGLLDIIEALQWIQRNIAVFGGDPNRVTLFGHSAGGALVLHLLSSSLAQGLFHQAILQSPAGLGQPLSALSAAESAGQQLLKGLGPANGDPLPALRSASVDLLLSMSSNQSFPLVADEWVLPSREGKHSQEVPLIIGASSNEFANLALLFPQWIPKNLEQYRAVVQQTGTPFADQLLALYPAIDDEAVQGAAIRYLTDRNFVCASRYAAEKRSGRTWLYLFSASSTQMPGGTQLGAFHGSDLRLLFNLEFGIPIGAGGQRLGEAMRRYWVRFAATGDPNEDGLPTWQIYSGMKPQYLELGDTIQSVSGAPTKSCDVFEKVWETISEQATTHPTTLIQVPTVQNRSK